MFGLHGLFRFEVPFGLMARVVFMTYLEHYDMVGLYDLFDFYVELGSYGLFGLMPYLASVACVPLFGFMAGLTSWPDWPLRIWNSYLFGLYDKLGLCGLFRLYDTFRLYDRLGRCGLVSYQRLV